MPITPITPTGPSAPNTLTPDAAGTISAPNTLTPDSAGTIAAPNTLSADAAGTISAPNTLSADAAGTVAVPNTLTADAVGTIAVPATLASVTPAALPRTLTPLVDPNFADGLYSQSGTPKNFSNLLTFTRASSATFINRIVKATGGYNYFVDNALTNVLRVEYDYQTGENLGALIEGPSTNLALYSEQLDNAAWTAQDGAAVTANAMVSPDLTTTADKIDFSTNIDGIVAQSVAATASPTGTFTFSIWLKADSPQVIIIRIGNNINSQSTINVTTDWKKFEVTGTGTGSQSVSSPQLRNSSASAKTVYAWGAQYEELPFATSYIKTEGAAVSRSKDDLSLQTSVALQNLPITIDSKFHTYKGTTSDQRHLFRNDGTVPRLRTYIHGGGAAVRSEAGSPTVGVTITDSLFNGQLTFVGTESLIAIYNNRTFVESVVNTTPWYSDLTGITYIGANVSTQHLNGHISRFTTYDKALTAQEISLL